METISSIQESDTSAIERVEAARERQRQEAADATNAATRRAVLLKSGVGIGAAALGIGLGALLTLYGVSLILHRPTLEEVATVMREQVSRIERQANEKVANAEGAAAGKYAALTRAAEEKKAAADEKAAAADKAMAEVKTVTEKFGSAGSGKSVVDFTIFRKREVGALRVTTGWAYKKVGDAAPSHQWCYVVNISDPRALSYEIAVDGVAIPFDLSKASRAGVTEQQVHQALPECEWFRGTNPNIVDKG